MAWVLARRVFKTAIAASLPESTGGIALPNHLTVLGGVAGGIVANEHRFAIAPANGIVAQTAFAF
jgi:hypothetical protein